MNEISWGGITRKRFAELLGRPCRRRMGGHRDGQHTSALMREDDEHEQEPTRRRRDDEEVGGRDLWRWFARNVRQDCEGGLSRRTMYFATDA